MSTYFLTTSVTNVGFSRFYLPETRGRDPVEVAALCKQGFSSRPVESPVNSASTVETFSISDVKEV